MRALLAACGLQGLLLLDYVPHKNRLWAASEHVICVERVQYALLYYRLRVVV